MSFNIQSNDCCKDVTSKLSVVALILGLMDDTTAATSVYLEQITGLPATYNQDLAWIPESIVSPRLSSFPFPNWKLTEYKGGNWEIWKSRNFIYHARLLLQYLYFLVQISTKNGLLTELDEHHWNPILDNRLQQLKILHSSPICFLEECVLIRNCIGISINSTDLWDNCISFGDELYLCNNSGSECSKWS